MLWVIATFVLFMLLCASLALGGLVRLWIRKLRRKPLVKSKTAFECELLTANELAQFHLLRCPDCTAQLLEGPHGGMSVNYGCSSERCGSRFNYMGPFGVERISNASPKLRLSLVKNGPYRTNGEEWEE